MIDSDPGGWPQSPLSDQTKIFQAARRLLDQYAAPGTRPTLVDWMHVGWGRHKFFTSTDSVVAAYDWTDKNPDESDVAFMGDTIRAFKAHVDEPWGLIAGQPPYLSVVAQEQVLGKTVYLPYGAIESEPAFPATNLGQDSVRRVFTRAGEFAGLRGVMGNNQLVLLQFPRTYFSSPAPGTPDCCRRRRRYPADEDPPVLQQALPVLDTAVTVTYAGSRGYDLTAWPHINTAAPGNYTNLQAALPYPQFGNLNLYESVGSSWYNSLQIKAEKRHARGLSYLISYVFSRDISNLGNDVTAQPTPYAPVNYDRGPSPSERRHLFTLSAIYELPVGRGKQFGGSMPRALDFAIGGWQVAGHLPLRVRPALDLHRARRHVRQRRKCQARYHRRSPRRQPQCHALVQSERVRQSCQISIRQFRRWHSFRARIFPSGCRTDEELSHHGGEILPVPLGGFQCAEPSQPRSSERHARQSHHGPHHRNVGRFASAATRTEVHFLERNPRRPLPARTRILRLQQDAEQALAPRPSQTAVLQPNLLHGVGENSGIVQDLDRIPRSQAQRQLSLVEGWSRLGSARDEARLELIRVVHFPRAPGSSAFSRMRTDARPTSLADCDPPADLFDYGRERGRIVKELDRITRFNPAIICPCPLRLRDLQGVINVSVMTLAGSLQLRNPPPP